ncbi:efflux RND transporter periplasmic adaptor subunit [Desulfoluna sp.]|uniref:efflux RND transporter periplasmic adaptor subunit n=1 Tax=Desulfoluna sp. TaxID=2045199 RepID=UPI00261237D7|nr:efflux RND transporter periplasmic adaptor subunit [Desulfoluna sp.]
MRLKNNAMAWLLGLGVGVAVTVLVGGVLMPVLKSGHPPGERTSITRDGHDHETVEALWTCSMHPFILVDEPGDCPVCGMNLIPKIAEAAASESPAERVVAYWRAPMNPSEIYDGPGQSAMGMDLVPVYEDALVGGVAIHIDPVMEQNMGVRLERAAQASLSRTLHTWGHVTYDETRTYRVSPRFSGWIQTLHVNFEGQKVNRGEPLFTVYSPELIAAQEEYLNARSRLAQGGSETHRRLLASAKRKLQNYAMPAPEIRRAERLGRALESVTVTSPYTGVVVTKGVMEGGYFNAGTTLYTLSDLSRVWVEAHVYEYEVGRVRQGQAASMALPFSPGKILTGKVAYVYPFMQGRTRDVTVRLEFDNRDDYLKPDMYANVSLITDTGENGVVIPAEAVLHSGSKETVFVRTGQGRFTPREVITGITLDDGRLHVLRGIAPGDEVVVSGQFLLDSESQLKEAVAKMMEVKNPKPPKTGPDSEDDDFFEDM